jgi:hypothetical protein
MVGLEWRLREFVEKVVESEGAWNCLWERSGQDPKLDRFIETLMILASFCQKGP